MRSEMREIGSRTQDIKNDYFNRYIVTPSGGGKKYLDDEGKLKDTTAKRFAEVAAEILNENEYEPLDSEWLRDRIVAAIMKYKDFDFEGSRYMVDIQAGSVKHICDDDTVQVAVGYVLVSMGDSGDITPPKP